MPKPFKISVMISGGGTTLKNLIDWQNRGELQRSDRLKSSPANHPQADCNTLRTPESTAKCVDHRDYDGVESFSKALFDATRLAGVDLVVMGGFLRRVAIPEDFVNRVINIHPSLIPAFCGKGNYGRRVHQAVVDYGCKVSGCTVHFVDDHYDHGPIIGQSTVEVTAKDSAESLAAKVFDAECELYPQVINAIATGKVRVSGRLVKWN